VIFALIDREISTVFSTVEQNFAAKPRNSAQRGANPKLLRHLPSAMVRKPVKTHAKTPSQITNQSLYPSCRVQARRNMCSQNATAPAGASKFTIL
jgi:hypothetical protein